DAPTAKTITYTEAYPVFPNDAPQVGALGPAVTTIDDSYSANGKTATLHEVCTKQ
ncbi:MAG: hypothetical protein IAI49_08980, partial [Candidatus Eremiobacteraeota bacterium]|nr:hypothetical protein [Candidatus Eremiobacteraeota bacterium]